MTHDVKTNDPFSIVKDSVFQTPMYFVTAWVDADRARDLLLYNKEPEAGKKATNRKASPTTVKDYSLLMLSDQWYLNPQPIIFSETAQGTVLSELNDGQQRLKAIILADQTKPGIEVPLTLAFEAPDKAMWVLDQGKRRLPGDHLRMAGEVNSNQLANALRMLYALERMRPFRSIGVWRKAKLTPVTQQEFLDEHPELRQALQFSRDTKGLIMPHVGAVLFYLVDREFGVWTAKALFTALGSGAIADTDDPRLKVREFISAKAREKPPYKWDGFEQLGLLIAAANAWLIGQTSFVAKNAFSKTYTVFPELFTKSDMPMTYICPGNDPALQEIPKPTDEI